MDPDLVSESPVATPARVKFYIALPVILLCVYLPYSWLLWIDYPWNDYRWTWLAMSPLMPGLVPAVWVNAVTRLNSEYLTFPLAVLLTVIWIVALTLLGMRRRRYLIVAALIALVISIPCALGAYSLFRA